MAVRWITEAQTNNPTSPDAPYAVEVASWILYKLTAEKYPGISERTEWYGMDTQQCGICTSAPLGGAELINTNLTLHKHVWYTNQGVRKIRLRGYPVRSVISVTYKGEVLDSSQYFVDNKKYLSRVDKQAWDLSQGLSITYTAGTNPPEAGIAAAIRLANEFILAAVEPNACALPERVTSVSSQGMDYTLLDAQDFLEHGRTGVYEVDIFIKAANPTNAKKKPRVFSVDLPSGNTRM